jgi:adapter protein MecA 1/2
VRIQKIGEDIIKVSISGTDLAKRNIDLNSFNGKSPAAQELFWDMMEKAEAEFGFNATDSQLAVEAVPDSSDGFIVTITKLENENEFESIQKYIKNKFKKTDLKIKKKNKRIYLSIVIYEVKNLDDLTFLCKQLHCIYNGDSSLFKHSNNYYLLLTKENITNGKLFELLLAEYGHKAPNAAFLEGYLNEYGTIMIQHNAVKILNDFY